MSTKIILKKSSVSSNAPGTGDLDYGEVALNFADGRLYYKTSSNIIKNFVDSDIVREIIDIKVAALGAIDSATILSIVQANSVDSAEVITFVDSNYVTQRVTTGVGLKNTNNTISIDSASNVTFAKITVDSAVVDQINFNTAYAGAEHIPFSEGAVWYDNYHKTLNYWGDDSNVIHEIGTEEHQKVYNNTGSLIEKGKPLYYSGNYVDGGGALPVPTVGLADATNVNAYNAQGLAAGDIANGDYGYVILSGRIDGIDTSLLNAGDNFFVGLTPGAVQNASPLYPNFPMCLGWVVISDSSDGVLIVNQQNHSVNSFRVRTSAHIGNDLIIDGNLQVNGTQTVTSTQNVSIGGSIQYLNAGNTIGEANTVFIGSGLDDAFFAGHYSGDSSSKSFYVKIDATGTPDTFEWGHDSSVGPVATGIAITGAEQLLDSDYGIAIDFGATTGHTLNDKWTGTAAATDVDTGFFTNRNTGDAGSGYTHLGFFFDVSTNKWRLLDAYEPEPENPINITDPSLSYGDLVLNQVEGNVIGTVSDISNHSTNDLTEGNLNLYYTTARADSDAKHAVSAGTGISYSSTTGVISTNDGQIVHDNLSGFVANEHIDHSGVTLTAGNGLTGGGTIAASRTFAVGPGVGIKVGANDVSIDSAEIVYYATPIRNLFSAGTGISYNSTTGAFSSNDAAIVHDNLSGFVANEHIDHSAVTLTAGNGLTGGGTIAASRTFAVGAGTGITVTADAVSTNDGQIVHDNLSGFVANEHIDHTTVSITAGNGLTGGGTIAATRTINVGDGYGIVVGANNISIDSAEIRALLSVTDNGGDGSLSYNNTTGVFSYTGPSAAEVRAHFSGGTGVTITNGVVAIGQAVGTSSNVTFNNVTINGTLSSDDLTATTVTASGNVIVQGNLTVNGTTTTINSNTVNIGDNLLVLNADEAGTPSQNAGIEVERGTSTNVVLQWNETSDQWEIASGGTTGRILTTGDEGSGNGLDADTLDGQQGSYYLNWTNVTNKPDPTITLAGDLSGSVTLTDLASGTLTATITKDPTITLTGDVTGSATMTNLGNVSISTTVAANSVALGTDTTGNYVATGAVSGNGLSGSASAEGATFTVTSNATNANTGSTIVFRDASGNFAAGAITATGLTVNGNAVIEDGYLYVGDVSGDNHVGIFQDLTNNRGFTSEFGNASVFSNLQGSTNQYLVLGDTQNLNTNTLMGVSVTTDSINYVKKLNLQGDGELFVGASGTSKVWHADNDGAGSGLDADTVDGIQAASFLRSDAADSWNSTLTYTGTVNSTALDLTNSDIINVNKIHMSDPGEGIHWTGLNSSVQQFVIDDANDNIMSFENVAEIRRAGNKVWDAGNDGAGSGLDADLLDGQQGTYYLDWTNTTNKPDPTLTLAGDVSGSATFTNLGNATLTVTIADDSHNHIISNVDGLQTALDAKLALAGGTMTGDLLFGDNDKAIFGAGSDLQIYHDGSNSYIQDAGTGNLFVQASNVLWLRSATGTAYLSGTAGNEVAIYHNGSEKLRTTTTGIDVTGTVTADGLTVNGNAVIEETATTLTTTSQTVIGQWSTSTYGGGKYLVQATRGGERHITELLITHNGTTAVATEYGSIWTSSSLATYEVDISGGNFRILATGTSSTSTVYKILEIHLI